MIRLSLLAALAVVAVIVVGVAGRALYERPQRGLLLVMTQQRVDHRGFLFRWRPFGRIVLGIVWGGVHRLILA